MKLLHHFSYRTPDSFRPKPQIIIEDSLNMIGVFFSWGEIDLVEKVFTTTRSFVEAHLNQSEITNPFGFNESLNGIENALRTGLLVSNDTCYRLANQTSLSSGVEGVIIVKKGSVLNLVQMGQPHIFLKRKALFFPLTLATDILGNPLDSGEFLPDRLIGTYENCYPQIQSVSIEPDDRLYLLAHSLIPKSFFDKNHLLESSLKKIFQSISIEYPKHPFWISELEI